MNFPVRVSLVLVAILVAGCTATITPMTTHAPVAHEANILDCPIGEVCRTGGQAASRVTVDTYGYIRGQAVREEWSAWGGKRPPVKFDHEPRATRYYPRRTTNTCYWYKRQDGVKACL